MKRLLLVLTVLSAVSFLWAGPISREQAQSQARQFLSRQGRSLTLKSAKAPKALNRAQTEKDYYYVFNVGQDQGYVIVSADDRTPAVLGYAEHGTFDADKIPANMAAWLQGYADQIRYVQEHPEAAVTRGDVATHANISNMLTTKWNQGSPYNDLFPTYGGQKCLTGCGATAMAQVMNYHGAPANSPAIPGYTTSTKKITCEGLPATSFNWSNMSSGSEVAKLMKYCAYAIKADLGPDWTSATDLDIINAFKGYFGYGNGVQRAMRDNFKEADWDMLIYNELANGRPVIYIGQSPSGGHFFILHGYSAIGGLNYYTVNWGWGGYEDGQFLLSAMDPPSYGAGNGFNTDQAAIVGISTSDVTPYQVEETVVLTTEKFEISGEKTFTLQSGYIQYGPVTFDAQFTNRLTRTYNIEANFKILKDGVFVEYLMQSPFTFNNMPPTYWFGKGMSLYFPNWSESGGFGKSFQEPGTYKVIPVSREVGTSEWIENIGSDKYYLTGVVDSNKKLTLYEGDAPGSNPDPDPKPEVTQDDLNQLSALFASQKAAIDQRITNLNANEQKLTDIAAELSNRQKTIDGLETKISAIEAKLTNDYLTADQKKSYTNELSTLKTKRDGLKSAFATLSKDLRACIDDNTALKKRLNSLLDDIATQTAAISSITTKTALEASKAKAADIAQKQEACNESNIVNKTIQLESEVAKMNIKEVETALSTLEATIDKAIETAKQTEQDNNEAREKLEAAKKDLLNSYTNLEKIWADKETLVKAYLHDSHKLDSLCKQIEIAIKDAEKKIAAIKKSLNNDMLSAAAKSDLENRLAVLDKEKTACAETLEDLLNNPMQKANAVADELETELRTVYQLIVENKNAVNDLTLTSDLEAAIQKYQDVEKRLQAIDVVADIKALLVELDVSLHNLTIYDVLKALDTLEDDIAKAIANGEEEYQKEQAEKLAKAKEDCQTALNTLDETINMHKDYCKDLKEVQGSLTAKMKEIADVITELKKQCAEIEQKLQELIARQTRNRAGASEVIAALQEKLNTLKEYIAFLESQYSQISDELDTLSKEIQQYDKAIETATQTRTQLQEQLSKAATIADVEGVKASVTKASNAMKSDGVSAYNLYVTNYNIVVDNLKTLINNINAVYSAAQALDKEVEATATGINGVVVDESEVQGRYDLKGNPVDSTYKGMQIIRLKNGKTIKINVK